MGYNISKIEENIELFIKHTYDRDYDGDDLVLELLEKCMEALNVDAVYVLVALINCEGYIFRYECFKDEKYNYINEIRKNTNLAENNIDYRIERSFWCDGVVGFIDGSGAREWTEEDRKILIKLGRALRPIVQRARLEKCTSELKKKEKLLSKMENHANSIIERDMKNRQYQNLLFTSMSEGFVLLTKVYLDTFEVTRFQILEGIIIEENQYKKWDEVYENYVGYMEENDRKRINEEFGANMFANRFLGDEFSFEYRSCYGRYDEDYRWHRSKIKILEESGRNIGIIYTENISKEKERERKLKETLEDNKAMYELVTSLVVDNFAQVLEIDIQTENVSELRKTKDEHVVKIDMHEKWSERLEKLKSIVFKDDLEEFCKIFEEERFEDLKKGEVKRIRFRAAFDFNKDQCTTDNEYIWYISRLYKNVNDKLKKVYICTISD